MKGDLYLGRWRLIPELCLYQAGDVPESGIYEITQADGLILISIQWRTRDGSDQQIAFSGPADGSRHASDAPGVDELSITRISGTVLDSSAYADGREILYARRSASRDGRLLSTVQAGTNGDTPFRNYQVYSRADV